MLACYTDYRYGKIYNWMVILGLSGGLCYQITERGFWGIFVWFVSLLIPFVITYPFYKMGGLGAGDSKWLSACAGFLSVQKVLGFLFVVFLISGMLSLLVLCVNHFREWKKKGETKRISNRKKIHMAGPICLGVLLYMGGVY